MAKTKTTYICQNCGAQSPKWVGKCPACNEWNTFEEEIQETTKDLVGRKVKKSVAKPTKISDITFTEQQRIDTTNNEFNRVLGGGLVPGSLVLIGGEPGIGKSTLALQIAVNLPKHKTLYVSGEESLQQIKLRAERVSIQENNCLVLSETSLENILLSIEEVEPDIIVIDSIQTIATNKSESTAGSVSQIRECTTEIMKYAKEAMDYEK